ncbi:MAG TPA: DedA family protein, partial [Rhodospirillales bacterium]|nr:DedA family protein [Rhodospirillales bacterium]
MLHRLYDWTLGLAAHKHAILALALISLVESSVFPIPPDILLIPMV